MGKSVLVKQAVDLAMLVSHSTAGARDFLLTEEVGDFAAKGRVGLQLRFLPAIKESQCPRTSARQNKTSVKRPRRPRGSSLL